jgi:predicted phage tail protein
MSLNRTAKGIVLVPSVLLGGAFLAAAAWGDAAAASNKGLALVLGGVLVGGGLLAQLLPEQADSPEQPKDDPLSAEKQGDSGEGA